MNFNFVQQKSPCYKRRCHSRVNRHIMASLEVQEDNTGGPTKRTMSDHTRDAIVDFMGGVASMYCNGVCRRRPNGYLTVACMTG